MRLIFAVMAAITSSSALAQPGTSTAQLAAQARTTVVTGENTMWHYGDTSCTGMASPALHEAVATCTGIADTAGRVVAFAAPGYSFTEADLVRCNRHVKS